MKGTTRLGTVSMKPVVAAGAALLAFAVLAVAFDPAWCVAVAKRAVYGPPPEPVSASITVTPDGKVSIDGEELREPVATKTQVTDAAQTVSGVLAVYNQEQYPILISGPTNVWWANAGGIYFVIRDISTDGWDGPDPQPNPPAGTELTYVSYIDVGGYHASVYPSGHTFHYLGTDTGYEIQLSFAVSVSNNRLWRTRGSAASNGRSNHPVYAKETSISDAWEAEPPITWTATFGELEWSGSAPSNLYIGPIAGLSFGINQHKGVTGYTYADFSVTWSGVDLSFDGMGKTISPLRFTGSGNTVTMDLVTDFAGSAGHNITIARPYLIDFSDFAVVDRDGNLLPNLLISGGFKADPRYPWTADCPLVPSS